MDPNCGHITWISNLVAVPKDEDPSKKCLVFKPIPEPVLEPSSELKVRLTCDARPVNKALKRTRLPMRTIDDLVVLINGATMFSKVDIV